MAAGWPTSARSRAGPGGVRSARQTSSNGSGSRPGRRRLTRRRWQRRRPDRARASKTSLRGARAGVPISAAGSLLKHGASTPARAERDRTRPGRSRWALEDPRPGRVPGLRALAKRGRGAIERPVQSATYVGWHDSQRGWQRPSNRVLADGLPGSRDFYRWLGSLLLRATNRLCQEVARPEIRAAWLANAARGQWPRARQMIALWLWSNFNAGTWSEDILSFSTCIEAGTFIGVTSGFIAYLVIG